MGISTVFPMREKEMQQIQLEKDKEELKPRRTYQGVLDGVEEIWCVGFSSSPALPPSLARFFFTNVLNYSLNLNYQVFTETKQKKVLNEAGPSFICLLGLY